MVCKGCVERLPFLIYYGKKYSNCFNFDSTIKNNEVNKNLTTESLDASSSKSSVCKLSSFNANEVKPTSIYFFDGKWRENLCRCTKCLVNFFV